MSERTSSRGRFCPGALVLLLLLGALSLRPVSATVAPVYFARLDLPIASDSIGYPRAVAADLHTGEIFVSDTRGNRIVIFDREALYTYQIVGGDVFTAPIDLAVTPEGYLLVLANHQRRRALIELDFDGLFRREITLTGLPQDIAEPRLMSIAIATEAGRIYLLDTVNLMIWVTDRQGRLLTSIDVAADVAPEDRPDFILGKLDLYADRLLLSVPILGEIHLYDLDGVLQDRVGIKGTSPCRLGFPTAAALDENGDLLVIDRQRMYILRWRPRDNRCLGEYYGIGWNPGYLHAPLDMSLDGDGRLYVAQGFEGRVQAYEGLAPAATLSPPEPEVAEEQQVVAQAPDDGRLEAPEATETSPALAVTVEDVGALIVAGARRSLAAAPRYDPQYAEISYPGGDLPPDRGAAVDVVVRAFRNAGIDLQEAIHEDILAVMAEYGINEPDPNIDHRRIRNVVTFFERNALSLPVDADGDWAPGDLVFWDRNEDGVAGHLGVVSDETGPQGRLRVIHHHRPDGPFDGTPSLDDALFLWPVVGHYRWQSSAPDETERPAPTPVEPEEAVDADLPSRR